MEDLKPISNREQDSADELLLPSDCGKQSRLHAQNDPLFKSFEGLPQGLTSHLLIEDACRLMLDAPPDFPARNDALCALGNCIGSLISEIEGTQEIRSCIESVRSSIRSSAADGATVLSLSRRKSQYLLYALNREIGHQIAVGKEPDQKLLKVVGAWQLVRLLKKYDPPGDAVAKIRMSIFAGQAGLSKWSSKARARCLNRAMKTLQAAISNNSAAATQYGLRSASLRTVKTLTPIETFNLAFRRRMDGLLEWATQDSIAGAGGYGTVCKSSLQEHGESLIDMAATGDNAALLVCIEIQTRMPSAVALQIPIQAGTKIPYDALAWIDVTTGRYYQTLYSARERARDLPVGAEALYLESTWVFWLPLPDTVRNRLQILVSKMRSVPEFLNDLVGDVAHHPRAAVAGDGAYRVTARKIQDSLPVLLLQAGKHRWPVALATNSAYLVSAGRKSYGVCRLSALHEAWQEASRLLNWPTNSLKGDYGDELIGTPTTPRPESITAALNFLSSKVDKCTAEIKTRQDIIMRLNAYAIWFSMVLSLGLALRQWLHYRLPSHELRESNFVHFDDKDVHAHKGPGIPICQFVRDATDGWYQLCQWAQNELCKLADTESLQLASEIKRRHLQCCVDDDIFVIDLVSRLQPVGYKTWWSELPKNLRLTQNFARHFWPLQLMDEGVEQMAIDLLMRHQISGLHPGSSHSVKVVVELQNRLRHAMDRVVSRLQLRTPRIVGGKCHE